MTETLALPSGHNTPLRVPSLQHLMEAGGDSAAIVTAVWAHDDIELSCEEDVEFYLDDEDVAFIVRWSMENLDADDLDALALIGRCFRTPPSRYLCIEDGPAALIIDLRAAARIGELEAEGEAEGEVSETRVVGRMDDPD